MIILVFPSCIEAAARFADEAHWWRQRVIGASSLEIDPYASRYDAWEKLPYLSDRNFFDKLRSLIDRQGIDALFVPHAPSFSLLEAELPSRLPKISLIGNGPYKTEVQKIEQVIAQAERDLNAVAEFRIADAPLPIPFMAGLMSQMDRIYGQCPREKVLAACAMMPSAIKGDIVEIGSLFGKSTYILNRLASYLDIGATLAIDPWNLDVSIQHDAPAHIQDAPRRWNWDIVRQGFLVNMSGCASPPFNYMRATSAEAYARYCRTTEVRSAEFGTTRYSGAIAVLHIDGNHDEVAVAEDFDLWSKKLSPGAWIIFDDYNWLHGDGPRKVADRAIHWYGTRVRRHFVAGGALFAQIDG